MDSLFLVSASQPWTSSERDIVAKRGRGNVGPGLDGTWETRLSRTFRKYLTGSAASKGVDVARSARLARFLPARCSACHTELG